MSGGKHQLTKAIRNFRDMKDYNYIMLLMEVPTGSHF